MHVQGPKAVMKDIAKYLPGIGWSFMFMEYPLLKRDWTKDRTRLESACKNLADYPVHMLVSSRRHIFFEEERGLSFHAALSCYSYSSASLRKAQGSLKRSMI